MDAETNESSQIEGAQSNEDQPELLNLYSQISTAVSKLNIIVDKFQQFEPFLSKVIHAIFQNNRKFA